MKGSIPDCDYPECGRTATWQATIGYHDVMVCDRHMVPCWDRVDPADWGCS